MNQQVVSNANMMTEDEIEAEAQSARMFKIARCERLRFFFISLIFFIIGYVYSVSHDMRDAIVIDRLDPSSIPYLKILVVLPTNILCVFILQKYIQNSTASQGFSLLTLLFGFFFCIYGIILMPFRVYIEPNEFLTRDWFSDSKMIFLGLQWLSAITLTVNSWTSSLLYLAAELWGTLVLQYLFFCFANEICTQRQSLRFTPLIMIFANIALIISGISIKSINYVNTNYSYHVNSYFSRFVFVFLGLVSFSGWLIHKYFVSNVLTDDIFVATSPPRRRSKEKVGFVEGLGVMASSKLVIAMASVVLAYSISVNLVESCFKSCMNQYAIEKGEDVGSHVIRTQSDIQLAVGVLAAVLLLSSFPALIRSHGFGYVAFIPPLFCLFGMASVFMMAAYNVSFKTNTGFFAGFARQLGPNLLLEQTLGVISIIGFKFLKYAAFDISKEALSMKISTEHRARFKSVYDGVCGKLGKAMGSGITNTQNMLYNTTDVREAATSSFFLIATFTTIWFVSVNYLSKKYNKSVQADSDIDIDHIYFG